MKIKLLSFLLVFSLISNAQFEVKNTNDNSVITDGQTLNFSVTGCPYNDSSCYWPFSVTNTSSSDIYVRIFVDGLTGTNGDNFQLCFATDCFNSVPLNTFIPGSGSGPALITMGASNYIGNSMWNNNSAGSAPMSYTFRFQAYSDSAATNPIGSLSMTYSYNSTFSTSDFNLSNVKIYPNSQNKTLVVDTAIDLNAEIYSILGKKVKSASLSAQNNQINVSNLTSQIYIVRLTDKSGKSITKKVVIE